MGVFRELLPSASRVVVLFNPENVSKPPEAARTVELAKELGLEAKAVQFLTAEDIKRAFSAFAADRPDGLIVLTEQRSMLHAKLLAELWRRERLPVFHSFSEGVHAPLFAKRPSRSTEAAASGEELWKWIDAHQTELGGRVGICEHRRWPHGARAQPRPPHHDRGNGPDDGPQWRSRKPTAWLAW